MSTNPEGKPFPASNRPWEQYLFNEMPPSPPEDYDNEKFVEARLYYLDKRRFKPVKSDKSPRYRLGLDDASRFLKHPAVAATIKSAVAGKVIIEGRPRPGFVGATHSGTWAILCKKLQSGLKYEHNNDRAFKSWLYCVCRNAVLEAIAEERLGEKKDRMAIMAMKSGTAQSTGHTLVDDTQTENTNEEELNVSDYPAWAAILGIVETLPLDQQEVILSGFAKKTGKEIAERLGISPPRVSQFKNQAIATIRLRLREMGFDIPTD